MAMGTFGSENILAWQKAHGFALNVYKATRGFPKEGRTGLMPQFWHDIAGGYKKLGKAGKLRFMNIAEGSLEECRDYMVLARDLGYINAAAFEMLCESAGQTGKLLYGYSNGILKNNAIKD